MNYCGHHLIVTKVSANDWLEGWLKNENATLATLEGRCSCDSPVTLVSALIFQLLHGFEVQVQQFNFITLSKSNTLHKLNLFKIGLYFVQFAIFIHWQFFEGFISNKSMKHLFSSEENEERKGDIWTTLKPLKNIVNFHIEASLYVAFFFLKSMFHKTIILSQQNFPSFPWLQSPVLVHFY